MTLPYYPAGTTAPLGSAGSAHEPRRPPARLARPRDPLTGEWLSLTKGKHPVDAAVEFNARAKYHSGPALGECGTRYHEINYATDSADGEYAAETKRWIKPFVDRQLIEVLELKTAIDGDLGAAFVAYKNRQTSRRGEVTT